MYYLHSTKAIVIAEKSKAASQKFIVATRCNKLQNLFFAGYSQKRTVGTDEDYF